MRKTATKRARNAPDPELTRSAFPELTRCDYCGTLDGGTVPTLEFNPHPGDGWHWLHPQCKSLFAPVISERETDNKDRLMIPMGRGGPMVDDLFQQPKCDYCHSDVGRIQHIAICKPGRLDVREVHLHPDCERGYLRLLDDPEESS